MDSTILLHYGALALTVGLTSLGVALAQGRLSFAAIDALYTQPSSEKQLSRHLLISLTLIETSAILGLISVLLLFFNTALATPSGHFIVIAQSCVIVAVGMVGLVVSTAASLPAQASMHAIARQPFFADKITNFMLLTITIIETPLIFGFLTILIIHTQQTSIATFNDALRLCAAGICIGLGAVGPAIGQGLFARSACRAIGVNRSAYRDIFSFALLSQTLIETPIILAFFSCLLIILSPSNPSNLKTIAFFASAFCIGCANIMPGIGSGRIASAACQQIGANKQQANAITRMSLIAQGLIDTLSIYGMIVGIMLIMFTQ